jgi:ketosteroid isomerase-like protein
MKIVGLFLLCCALAHGAVCPTAQTKDEATLVQIERTWVQIVEQHDTVALSCILADEFEEADSKGALITRASMLASAAKQGGGAHSELSDMHARIYGDFAYVRGLAVTRTDGGKPPVEGRFTDIFIYRDGRWQCIAGHESHFPESHLSRE